MFTSQAMVRTLLGFCFLMAFFLLPVNASAEILGIQYTGLDISYDGSTITQVGNPDPLNSLVFTIDGVQEGSTLTSDIAIELSIPGVSGLPVAGGTATSSAGGTLGLTLPGGDFLNLELGATEITFVSIDNGTTLQFVLGAGDGDVLSQSLPIDGEFAEDVAVSFSTQVQNGSLTQDGGIVTGFLASGTGEIEGNLVPEPSTTGLLLCGLLAGLAVVRLRVR